MRVSIPRHVTLKANGLATALTVPFFFQTIHVKRQVLKNKLTCQLHLAFSTSVIRLQRFGHQIIIIRWQAILRLRGRRDKPPRGPLWDLKVYFGNSYKFAPKPTMVTRRFGHIQNGCSTYLPNAFLKDSVLTQRQPLVTYLETFDLFSFYITKTRLTRKQRKVRLESIFIFLTCSDVSVNTK